METAKTLAAGVGLLLGSLWLSSCTAEPDYPSPAPRGVPTPSGPSRPTALTVSPYSTPFSFPTASLTSLSREPNSTVEGLGAHDGGLCSSNRMFCIGSANGGLQLYRTADHEVLGFFDGLPFAAIAKLEWSGDNTVAALLADTGAVYLWPADGTPPMRAPVAIREPAYTELSWSPGSLLLAIVEEDEQELVDPNIAILSSDGTEIASYVLPSQTTSPHWGLCGWHEDSLVFMCDNYGGLYYYEASSGRFLFRWQEAPHTGSGDIEQPPMFSPDGHWVAINLQMGCIDNPECVREYDLVDLKTRARHTIALAPGTYLDFVTWTPDSALLYVISRASGPTATGDPRAPFGLLAIDPVTMKVEVLFDQAVQAEFSPDLNWAFVLFPAQTEIGDLGLMGGLWKVGTTTMLGRHKVSEKILYADPAVQDWFGRPSLVPVAWSTDGIRVAWGDSLGNIRTQSIRGADKILLEGWIQDWDEWVEYGMLSWSEGSTRLLVQDRNRSDELPVR